MRKVPFLLQKYKQRLSNRRPVHIKRRRLVSKRARTISVAVEKASYSNTRELLLLQKYRQMLSKRRPAQKFRRLISRISKQRAASTLKQIKVALRAKKTLYRTRALLRNVVSQASRTSRRCYARNFNDSQRIITVSSKLFRSVFVVAKPYAGFASKIYNNFKKFLGVSPTIRKVLIKRSRMKRRLYLRRQRRTCRAIRKLRVFGLRQTTKTQLLGALRREQLNRQRRNLRLYRGLLRYKQLRNRRAKRQRVRKMGWADRRPMPRLKKLQSRPFLALGLLSPVTELLVSPSYASQF